MKMEGEEEKKWARHICFFPFEYPERRPMLQLLGDDCRSMLEDDHRLDFLRRH